MPRKFKYILKRELKDYETFFFPFNATEKSKSLRTVDSLLKKMLLKNLNRSDLIMGVVEE